MGSIVRLSDAVSGSEDEAASLVEDFLQLLANHSSNRCGFSGLVGFLASLNCLTAREETPSIYVILDLHIFNGDSKDHKK